MRISCLKLAQPLRGSCAEAKSPLSGSGRKFSEWAETVGISGAGSENRTRTLSPEPDFESGASTSSATPAGRRTVYARAWVIAIGGRKRCADTIPRLRPFPRNMHLQFET